MPTPEITRLTPDNATFNVPDLQRFLAQAEPAEQLSRDVGGVSSVEAVRLNVPERPGLTLQRTDLADIDAPDSVGQTPDTVEEFVRNQETELSRLALCGARIPLHTTYLVGEDQNRGHPARLYTIAQRPEGRIISLRETFTGSPAAHEKMMALAETIFDYHTQRSLTRRLLGVAHNPGAYAHVQEWTGPEFADLSPVLLEPRSATILALDGLTFLLKPAADLSMKKAADVLDKVRAYQATHNLPVNGQNDPSQE